MEPRRSFVILFFLFLLFISISVPVSAMDFEIERASGAIPVPTGLRMAGEIQTGDTAKLLRLLLNEPVDYYLAAHKITINSPGGNVHESILLARLIKQLNPMMIVDGQCVSACAFLYFAAPWRLAYPGTVGLHRPYYEPSEFRNLSPSEAEEKVKKLDLEVKKFIKSLDLPQSLIDRMFLTASNDIYWLDLEELETLQMPSWYEELLIARCQFNKKSPPTPSDSDPVFSCIYDVLRAERRRSFDRFMERIRALVTDEEFGNEWEKWKEMEDTGDKK